MKILKSIMMLGGLMLLFSACETDVEDPAGARNEALVPGIENLNPATFDSNDLENTYIQFDLTMPGSGVSEAILLTSSAGNRERVEVTSVTSFPANITVPLTDVVSALGISLDDVVPGDVFAFEVKTVQGGNSYFSSAAFTVAVVCGYEVANVTGNYNGASASWAVDGSITLEADPEDEYTIYVHGLAELDGLTETGPVTMHVNPLDYSVQAPASTIAADAFGYTGLTYAGSGSLNTCNGKYSMMFAITVDQGSFGSFEFEFTKQ